MDWQTISGRIQAWVQTSSPLAGEHGGDAGDGAERPAPVGELVAPQDASQLHWAPALPQPFRLEHLWMLRILVPLGGHEEALGPRGIKPSGLAAELGLTHWERLKLTEADYLEDLRALHALAEAHASEALAPEPLHRNVQTLGELMNLSPLERQVLLLALLVNVNSLFDDTADNLGHRHESKRAATVARILNAPEPDVESALSPLGNLAQKGLLDKAPNAFGLLRTVMGLAVKAKTFQHSYHDPMQLVADNCVPLPAPTLGLDDYQHLRPALDALLNYLQQALAQHKRGVNVLLYGSPGTGKTELAALLGSLSCEKAWAVPSADEDGDPLSPAGRSSAYRFAQSLLAGKPTLLLFDEAEDIFQPLSENERHPRTTQKCWFTKLLEENPQPCLWVANRISGIDPALVRRFDMVLEVPIPPRPQRRRVLKTHCEALLSEPLLEQLSEHEGLAPAVVARTAQVVQMACGEALSAERPALFKGMLSATLKAQGLPVLRDTPELTPSVYDPELVNADVNLATLALDLQAQPHARICLYGPPGTGKSAWARWMAQQLERPLMVKRGSDLISKYVGETERRMAQAFSEAQSEGAVLLLDEVDSFLRDRRQAEHSWQITEVNEMLTQMEVFDGLFVATTNLLEGMDPASMRRFDLKVQFQAMRTEQAITLLEQHARDLGLGQLGEAEAVALRRCSGLTPGDFAVVARQHRFRKLESIQDFITRLAEELKHRQPIRQTMGFLGGKLNA